MMIDCVMDTYLDLGFITKEQYVDFGKEKTEVLVNETGDNTICRKFCIYLGILPTECDTADAMIKTVQSGMEESEAIIPYDDSEINQRRMYKNTLMDLVEMRNLGEHFEYRMMELVKNIDDLDTLEFIHELVKRVR